MSDTTVMYDIRQSPKLRQRWERLDTDAKRFVLAEIKGDSSEKAVTKAISKWRRKNRHE